MPAVRVSDPAPVPARRRVPAGAEPELGDGRGAGQPGEHPEHPRPGPRAGDLGAGPPAAAAAARTDGAHAARRRADHR